MAAISLDLSGLTRDEPTEPVLAPPSGEAPRLPLSDIDPDPNQPRKAFTPEGMAELVASVKVHGVISPISVRPNPDKPGRWLINYGERRYRASVEVGNDDIPAIINEKLSSYAQVIENLQREDLKPIEVALFIAGRKADGEKNAEIARQLGVDRSVINHYLALLDAPASIERAYQSGKTASAKTIYELRSLHEKHPAEVDAWLAEAEEVTRGGVKALADALKKPAAKTGEPGQGGASVGHDQQNKSGEGQGGTDGDGDGDGENNDKRKTNSAQDGAGANDADNQGKRTSWPPGKVASDPDLIKRPLLLVEVAGRAAVLLLNRKPSDADRARIRYEDNGADEEVAVADCKLLMLLEEPKG